MRAKITWKLNIGAVEVWRFQALYLSAAIGLLLGIPFPKEDLDGSQIHSVYYWEGNVERIAKYCELDVVTTAQVFLRLRNEELMTEDQIFQV